MGIVAKPELYIMVFQRYLFSQFRYTHPYYRNLGEEVVVSYRQITVFRHEVGLGGEVGVAHHHLHHVVGVEGVAGKHDVAGLDIHGVEEDVKRRPYLIGVDMHIAVKFSVIYLSSKVQHQYSYDDAENGAGNNLLTVYAAFPLSENLFDVLLFFVGFIGEVLHWTAVLGTSLVMVDSRGSSRQNSRIEVSVRNFCKSAMEQSRLYWKLMNFSQHSR